MAQTILIDEGCFTYQDKVAVNSMFTELYSDGNVETGTTALPLLPAGLSTVNSSVATTFALAAPTLGETKYLECIGATANVTVSTTAAAATIGAAGSSLTKIVFTAADQAITLFGETTAKWVRLSQNTSLITVTT